MIGLVGGVVVSLREMSYRESWRVSIFIFLRSLLKREERIRVVSGGKVG